MNRLRFPFFNTFFLLFFMAVSVRADDIQKIIPTSYVTDLAGVIPSATRQRLEVLCTELEQKTGAQMAIVTVRSLDDRPVEDYAVDLFKHLGVGSKKESSGVLLLVAPSAIANTAWKSAAASKRLLMTPRWRLAAPWFPFFVKVTAPPSKSRHNFANSSPIAASHFPPGLQFAQSPRIAGSGWPIGH
jgi:hypothetical protein